MVIIRIVINDQCMREEYFNDGCFLFQSGIGNFDAAWNYTNMSIPSICISLKEHCATEKHNLNPRLVICSTQFQSAEHIDLVV